MIDQYIVSPYFLDEPQADMIEMAGSAWRVATVTFPGGQKTTRMGVLYQRLADEVAATLAAGQRPVALLGDCCASIGVLAGLQRAGQEPTLIWFDAHGDFNTHDTSPSGFLGGMPLAMAVGLGEQTLLKSTDLRPWPVEKVILTDGRDLDPGEKELVARSGITHLPDVAHLLAPGAIPAGPLYIHFDVDVINLDEAPAMSYPAPGGPSSALLQQVFRALADTGRVVAISVSLFDPELDPDGRTEAVYRKTVTALLGDQSAAA